MSYVIPSGKTRQFTFQIKLDDDTLVTPDSIDFSLSDEINFKLVTATYRAYIGVPLGVASNIQAHLLAKAKYTHAGQLYKFNLDIIIITGDQIIPDDPSDTPISLDIIPGDYVPQGV